jgi:hypothetical protein
MSLSMFPPFEARYRVRPKRRIPVGFGSELQRYLMSVGTTWKNACPRRPPVPARKKQAGFAHWLPSDRRATTGDAPAFAGMTRQRIIRLFHVESPGAGRCRHPVLLFLLF